MRFFGIILAVILSFIYVTPVLADPPGIVATVNVIGDNPLANVNLVGDNGQAWINGVPLSGIISSGVSAATQAATPNSQYSGVGTGMLPPLGLIPEVNAIAPGKYTQPYVGWIGYFCPQTNTSPYVYKGSGCGGRWGVADGYPDLWGRRQIAGIAVDFTIQREKLLQSQAAIVKMIGELKNNNESIGNLEFQLMENLDNISAVTTDLSVMEEEGKQYRQQVAQQFEDMNNKLLLVAVLAAFGFVALCVMVVILYKKTRHA